MYKLLINWNVFWISTMNMNVFFFLQKLYPKKYKNVHKYGYMK